MKYLFLFSITIILTFVIINTAAAETMIPIDQKMKELQTKTATFALGCFWGPDAVFGILEGVVRTRVGYAGGTTENPTYDKIGNHTETIEIDYDPGVINYQKLLEIFFNSHNPYVKAYSIQ